MGQVLRAWVEAPPGETLAAMHIPILTDLKVAQETVLRRAALDEDTATTTAVAAIIAEVRKGGDAALRQLSARFDGVVPPMLEVPQTYWAQAVDALPNDLRTALEVATDELRRFHARQARNSWVDVGVEGTRGQLVVPLQRVGIYVPGGVAPLPSSLIHAAIPARVAGVEELIVCSPPQREHGLPAAVVLAAAQIAGVDRVFAVGGAQAIAAMAYGSVGIESLPGPTETLLIADAAADPRYVAADLLAQAEHVEASAILLTPSTALAHAVVAEIERQLNLLPELNARAARETVSSRGAIVIVPDIATAFTLANEYGPEHLCLLLADPWPYVGLVRNAGGVFLGEHSFEVLGDYCAGPSHIMPTEGTARYASPVNVDDFRKVISLVGLNAAALARIGPAAQRIAEAEGLYAHAAAVRARLEG